MKNLILAAALIVLSVTVFSCDGSTTPSDPVIPSLTVKERTFSVAMNITRYITISGGKGSYHVLSVSDSGIVSIVFNSYYISDGIQYASGLFNPLKFGTTIVTIEDSAKTARVTLTVTVTELATYPTTMKLREQSGDNISIVGGTPPYSIHVPSNPLIARVEMSSTYPYAFVTAVNAGMTGVTFKDNANPAHYVTVPIEITPIPRFTTPGTVSFTSGVGNFAAHGIAEKDYTHLSAGAEGAGGWIISLNSTTTYRYISAYRKKDADLIDVVSIVFFKEQQSPGTVPFDTTYLKNTATGMFVLNGVLETEMGDVYRMTSGSVNFTELSSQLMKGTFTGTAMKTQMDVIIPGTTTTVTGGTFDVPVLIDAFGAVVRPAEGKRIQDYLEQVKARTVRQFLSRTKVKK